MKPRFNVAQPRHRGCLLLLQALLLGAGRLPAAETVGADPMASRKTAVSIVGDEFRINGRPTYPGRVWDGHRIQGLLLNSRMVQGIFDDRNPETVKNWAYPDTGKWDAGRNTREFIAAMPEWRRRGLLAFTINLQGGSPQGYSKDQPWHNSAFEADGSLRPDYMNRLQRILDKADELIRRIEDLKAGVQPPFLRAQAARFRARLSELEGKSDGVDQQFKTAEQITVRFVIPLK